MQSLRLGSAEAGAKSVLQSPEPFSVGKQQPPAGSLHKGSAPHSPWQSLSDVLNPSHLETGALALGRFPFGYQLVQSSDYPRSGKGRH